MELKHSNLSFAEAAALPIGAMTAMYLWEKAKLQKGHQVFVYGASGSVGSYAVQLAKQAGAKAHAACSGPNFDMVRNLGAEVCVDYKVEDYSLRKENYDIVFDAVGKTSKSKAKKVLSKGGKFVSVSMPKQEKDEHLLKIKNMAEAGSLILWIDKTYALEQIVEAHTYVDEGHKRGNISIQL